MDSIELRPHGWIRFVVVAFLSFWLAGWLAGELFVLKALLGLIGVTFDIPFLDGDPSMSGELTGVALVAFLLVWFVFWTFGGIAAMIVALRLLFGRDVIELTPTGFAVRQAIGPFERVIEFHRHDVSELRIKRSSGAILAVVKGRTVDVTHFGTDEEMHLVLGRIRAHTGITSTPPKTAEFPDDWVESREPDGTIAYTNRWVTSASCLAGCAVAGLASVAVAAVPILFMGRESSGANIFWAVVGVILLVLATLFRTANDVWRISDGRLEIVRTFGLWRRTTEVRDAVLFVRLRIDDDNDEHTELLAIGKSKEHRLLSHMNAGREVVSVARRVAEITGWDLTISPDVEPEE